MQTIEELADELERNPRPGCYVRRYDRRIHISMGLPDEILKLGPVLPMPKLPDEERAHREREASHEGDKGESR